MDSDTLREAYGPGFHATSQQSAGRRGDPAVVNAEARAAQLAGCGLRGRLLDVGAGAGAFVAAASRHFQADGLERAPLAAAAAQARGVRVAAGEFPASAPPGPYEVITFWDVVASIVSPREAFAAVAAKLVPGGNVIFTVPLVTALAARVSGPFWPLWIPPVNLHYFSHRSVRHLLRTAGLVPVSLGTSGKRVAFEFLVRKALRALNQPAAAARLPRLPGGAVTVDLGDILTVCARRPAA